MSFAGWLSIALVHGAVLVCAWPLGLYMARVFQGEKVFVSSLVQPVERALYRAAGVEPHKEHTWLAFTLAMLAFNGLGFLLLYALMRLQAWLPLNPQGFATCPTAPSGSWSLPTASGRC